MVPARRNRVAVPLLAALLISPLSARADDTVREGAYAGVNAAMVETHVLPRYERLVAAAADFSGATRAFCGGPANGDRSEMRARYHDAMDAWMGVQHLRFGPVELFSRGYRIYFWPEGRGRTVKSVRELLADIDKNAEVARKIEDAGIAAQGLTAAEYLLFGPDHVGPGGGFGPVPCAAVAGIAENLHAMSAGIVADWRGGNISFVQTVIAPGPDNPYFQTHQEATLAFFQSLYAGLQLIADIKLKPVLGDSIDASKPRLAESRLSDRSLRNVVVNLRALEALYLGEGDPGLGGLVEVYGTGDPKLAALMRRAFRLTIETAQSIDPPLADAVLDPNSRHRVKKLHTQVLALKQIVRTRLAAALGVLVGFNALDGD